jgi:hypothetical protein
MAKEDLIVFLKRLLLTNEDMEFLLRLDQADLMTLVALIRQRVDQSKR